MYIGLDEENNRITADEAVKGNNYRCPVCEERLELRQGARRMHHFAHWKGLSCSDTWSSDMSEWHLRWQSKFPKENLEVVVEREGIKHRADVLIEDSKLVIEFQHSTLTPLEFKERNEFYTGCGYHVVWLFDMSEAFQKNNFMLSEEGNYYIWKHAWGTFWNSESTQINFSKDAYFDPRLDLQEILPGLEDPTSAYMEDTLVFFENNGTIERLLFYEYENKKVVTSRINDKYHFYWSSYTFELWLKKCFQPYRMFAPYCTKCKKKMVLRTYSFGGFLWGCQNFCEKEIDCRERIELGNLPIHISVDNKCPFCAGNLKGTVSYVRCEVCQYTVPIQTF